MLDGISQLYLPDVNTCFLSVVTMEKVSQNWQMSVRTTGIIDALKRQDLGTLSIRWYDTGGRAYFLCVGSLSKNLKTIHPLVKTHI
jgi:hypothetical protein